MPCAPSALSYPSHQTVTVFSDTRAMAHPPSYTEFLNKYQPAQRGVSLVRFALVFGAIFFLLQWAYQGLADTGSYRFYIEQLTVRPSAYFIHIIAPHDGVIAQAHRLVWNGGRLSVLNGCDGAEAIQLMLAAFVASAVTWRTKLTGMAMGLLLVYVLNQARLIALYFAIRHDKAVFEIIHGLAGPLIIIALVTLFFAWWTTPRESQAAA